MFARKGHLKENIIPIMDCDETKQASVLSFAAA